jgi:hypothetical protein
MMRRESSGGAATTNVYAAKTQKGLADARETACADKAGEMQHRLKSLIGVTCEVAVEAPGEVPRSQGKAVRVKDRPSSPSNADEGAIRVFGDEDD